MPSQRNVRQRTGNHRKIPLRDCQEQYRWKRGLDTLEMSLQSALQTQILACNRLSQSIVSQTAALMVEAEDAIDLGDREEYLDEAVQLLMIQDEVVRPVTEYYFDEESELGDIAPGDDEADHDFGLPRNRSIAAMSDYDARRYTRFSKEELARILFLFHLEAVTSVLDILGRRISVTCLQRRRCFCTGCPNWLPVIM